MKDIIQWRRESKSWIDKEKEDQEKGEGKSASEQPPVYVFMRAAAAGDNTKPN